jgi:hypothetical protein
MMLGGFCAAADKRFRLRREVEQPETVPALPVLPAEQNA